MKKKMMVTIVIVITMAISLMTGCSNTTKMPEDVQPEEEIIEEAEEVVEETAVTVERKLFEPAMIKVENLPEWLSESDLEDGFISTHKLMEIAKNMGKDLELETDGKAYTIKSNMVAHKSIETVAVQEETEEVEKPEEVTEEPKEEMPQASEPSTPAQVPPTPSEPSTTDQQTPVQPSAHEHNWVAVTEQVWVEDKAAWDETVLVKEAWDETVTQTEPCYMCWRCGATYDATAEGASACYDHTFTCDYPNPEYGDLIGSSFGDTTREVGTTTIHHEAEYTTVHHDATGHYEDVTTGYKCSSCGAQQ